jgi:hypothetical protein
MVSIKFYTIMAITYRISGGTRCTGTAYNTSGATEFTLGFSGVRIAQSLVFAAVFLEIVCLFVLFLLAIVLSVLLRFTSSKYPFGIFKLLFMEPKLF